MTFNIDFTISRDGGKDGMVDYHAPKNYHAVEAHARAIKALLEQYGWDVYEPVINGIPLERFLNKSLPTIPPHAEE